MNIPIPCHRCDGDGFEPNSAESCTLCLGRGKLDVSRREAAEQGYDVPDGPEQHDTREEQRGER